MSITSVQINPSETGYAIILFDAEHNRSAVCVMTMNYVKYVLPKINADFARRLGQSYPDNVTPEQAVKFTEACYKLGGLKDRTPHFNEIVDVLLDCNPNETDINKAIKEVKQYHNLGFGGTFLVPAYPELIPMPHIPFLPSPI